MDKDDYFMAMAQLVSMRSKCLRAKYGTVLVSEDSRVVATGYNGKPRGSDDSICYRQGLPMSGNSQGPACCIHSEANALLFANPHDLFRGTAYVSGVPCEYCTLLLLQSGISRVVYRDLAAESGHMATFNSKLLVTNFSRSVSFEAWRPKNE